MQALGNDFVMIESIFQVCNISTLAIKQLANRHLGIGFDQLISIEKGQEADFFCRIFNVDGSEAEQCGNGLRCVAKLVYDLGLTNNLTFTLQTKAGLFPVEIKSNSVVSISMGLPIFEPSKIPFITESQRPYYLLNLKYNDVKINVLSMGNPHAILEMPSSTLLAQENVAAEIAKHSAFPNGVNIGFIEIINRNTIRLRTFERGVGETYACGSNACAAVVSGIMNKSLDNKVKVELLLGTLEIEWGGVNEPVFMTGPANYVFEGFLKC